MSRAKTATQRISPAAHTGAAVYLTAIGDSHASLFSGVDGLQPVWPETGPSALPGIRAIRLGSRLAHSLAQNDHPVRALVRKALKHVGRDEVVLLTFGEIDCRCHVVPQADRTGKSIEVIAKELARRYVRAVREIVDRRTAGVLVPPPPPRADVIDPAFPTRGTFEQRAAATRAFSEALRAACAGHDVRCVSFSSQLVSARGERREEFFQDLIHCRVTALPMACEALIAAACVPPERVEELRIASAALAKVPWRPSAAAIYAPPQLSQLLPSKHDSPTAVELALLDRAALECVWMGAARVAVYGAGMHTKRVGLEFLRRRGLDVVAVLDDHARPTSPRMFGLPVITPQDRSVQYECVVLSSDAHEDAMAARAASLFTERGVRVVRIYGWREPWPGMTRQQ